MVDEWPKSIECKTVMVPTKKVFVNGRPIKDWSMSINMGVTSFGWIYEDEKVIHIASLLNKKEEIKK